METNAELLCLTVLPLSSCSKSLCSEDNTLPPVGRKEASTLLLQMPLEGQPFPLPSQEAELHLARVLVPDTVTPCLLGNSEEEDSI